MFREASKEEPTSKKKNLLTSENKKKLKQKHKKSYFSFSPYCNRFKNSNLDSHKCYDLTCCFCLKFIELVAIAKKSVNWLSVDLVAMHLFYVTSNLWFHFSFLQIVFCFVLYFNRLLFAPSNCLRFG
jgi:hypothetical protein